MRRLSFPSCPHKCWIPTTEASIKLLCYDSYISNGTASKLQEPDFLAIERTIKIQPLPKNINKLWSLAVNVHCNAQCVSAGNDRLSFVFPISPDEHNFLPSQLHEYMCILQLHYWGWPDLTGIFPYTQIFSQIILIGIFHYSVLFQNLRTQLEVSFTKHLRTSCHHLTSRKFLGHLEPQICIFTA